MTETIIKEYKTTSITKYIILSFLTLGIYQLIWMYKAWEYINEKFGMNLNSAKRTVFSIIYIGSLTWHINILLNKDRRINLLISIAIEILFIFSAILSAATENYFLMFFTIIPMIPLIIAINKLKKIDNKEISNEGRNPKKNSIEQTHEPDFPMA